MKVPQWKITGDIRGQLPQSFLCPPNCVVLRTICFKHMIKQNLSPLKMYFAPQTLKPGYGHGSAKIVPAIRTFCFEGHSASRCSITSKTFFYKSPLGGPCKHFEGLIAGLIRHCLGVKHLACAVPGVKRISDLRNF